MIMIMHCQREYLSTSLKTCEGRDFKGLYKKARDGKIPMFTGISDPFDIPLEGECDFEM